MNIATLSLGESEWDTWDNQQVKPQLSFIERNQVTADSRVGLHRHVANQEMYLVESGRFIARHGIAPVSSKPYSVDRIWNSEGDMKRTNQINATGGWIEERVLKPGDMFIIVPSASQKIVAFHGIEAEDDGVFWTLGTKN